MPTYQIKNPFKSRFKGRDFYRRNRIEKIQNALIDEIYLSASALANNKLKIEDTILLKNYRFACEKIFPLLSAVYKFRDEMREPHLKKNETENNDNQIANHLKAIQNQLDELKKIATHDPHIKKLIEDGISYSLTSCGQRIETLKRNHLISANFYADVNTHLRGGFLMKEEVAVDVDPTINHPEMSEPVENEQSSEQIPTVENTERLNNQDDEEIYLDVNLNSLNEEPGISPDEVTALDENEESELLTEVNNASEILNELEEEIDIGNESPQLETHYEENEAFIETLPQQTNYEWLEDDPSSSKEESINEENEEDDYNRLITDLSEENETDSEEERLHFPELFQLNNKIGQGTFGKLYKCVITDRELLAYLQENGYCPRNDNRIAVKFILGEVTQEKMNEFKKEGMMGDKLQPNIPGQFTGCNPCTWATYGPDKEIVVVSRLAEGGDALDYFSDKFGYENNKIKDEEKKLIDSLPPKADIASIEQLLKEKEKEIIADRELMLTKMFAELMQGMEYMHSKGILNLDIAARNVLINEKGEAMFSDFGLSYDLNLTSENNPNDNFLADLRGKKFPIKWSNDERFLSNVASKATDLYSFKIMMLELMAIAAGKSPNSIFPGGVKEIKNMRASGASNDADYLKKCVDNLLDEIAPANDKGERQPLNDLRCQQTYRAYKNFENFLTVCPAAPCMPADHLAHGREEFKKALANAPVPSPSFVTSNTLVYSRLNISADHVQENLNHSVDSFEEKTPSTTSEEKESVTEEKENEYHDVNISLDFPTKKH